MTLHTVSCDQVAPQAWRNGGGQTRELLAWPQAQDWQLRISVADIARDGPFSAYPGVERWFAVVEGAGVVLRLAAGAQRLDTDSAPLHFRGEDAAVCALLDGPTRDLNLMVQRGQGPATMQRAEPGASDADDSLCGDVEAATSARASVVAKVGTQSGVALIHLESPGNVVDFTVGDNDPFAELAVLVPGLDWPRSVGDGGAVFGRVIADAVCDAADLGFGKTPARDPESHFGGFEPTERHVRTGE